MKPHQSTFVTPQQAVVHALFVKHRSMSEVGRILGLSQIRIREALVQHERNRMRDAGIRPPTLKEMLKGDVTVRFGVPREEFGGRPAKHAPLSSADLPITGDPANAWRPPRHSPVPKSGVRRFVVTAVEADGRVHAGFWQNLKAYAGALGAEIVVARIGPPAARIGRPADHDDFVADNAIDAGGAVDIACDEAIPARLARPLDAVRHRTKATWTLFFHSVVSLETLPRMRAHGLKVHLTTGAMTIPRAGTHRSSAELGAVVVELAADGAAHCRHLLAAAGGDGTFQDLDRKVMGGVVHRGRRVEGLTFGDVHHSQLDPDVAVATWGGGGAGGDTLVDRLRPRVMVFHDVVDFDAGNPHDARDHHKRFAQLTAGGGDVRAELAAASAFLGDTRRDWARSVVVGSNHDAALLAWLRETDFRDDPGNALFFLQTSLALHRRLAAGGSTDGFFEQTLRGLSPDGLRGVRFLRTEESLELVGSEAALHGHLGADGRPGDVRYFERMGMRATLGHTHRPFTRGGLYGAGTCATGMAYARGPITAWAVGHVVTYATGARQHLLFNGGRFFA